jgi:hypothetical protein
VQSEDPEVQRLKEEAGQAIKAGEYGKADSLLDQADELDRQAEEKLRKSIHEQQEALTRRQLSRAETFVTKAQT